MRFLAQSLSVCLWDQRAKLESILPGGGQGHSQGHTAGHPKPNSSHAAMRENHQQVRDKPVLDAEIYISTSIYLHYCMMIVMQNIILHKIEGLNA